MLDRVKFALGRILIWALKTIRGYTPTKGLELPPGVSG
jgi:hypothetical protein